MTTTGRRKVFRRKMWAVVHKSGAYRLMHSEGSATLVVKACRYDHPGLEPRVIPVLVTQIRAGRGGKRGRRPRQRPTPWS